MAQPGWVADLYDYWRWLEGELEASGGYLEEDDVLVVQPFPDPDTGERPIVAVVPKQRLCFHDGSYMDFTLVLAQPDPFREIEARTYSFHYARPDDMIVWRYDKHPDHPGVTETHVHWPPDERAESCGEVDIADIVGLIVEDQARSA